jgi:hypothetical protein
MVEILHTTAKFVINVATSNGKEECTIKVIVSMSQSLLGPIINLLSFI